MKEQMEKLGEEKKDGKPNEEGEEGEKKKGENQEGEEQQDGEGNSSDEDINGELFEIYKRQVCVSDTEVTLTLCEKDVPR